MVLLGVVSSKNLIPFTYARLLADCHLSRLTSCSFQFLFGKLYHQFSIKYVFLAFIVIFEIGSLLAGSALTSAMLVAGRAVSGFGCAGMSIISGVFVLLSLSSNSG